MTGEGWASALEDVAAVGDQRRRRALALHILLGRVLPVHAGRGDPRRRARGGRAAEREVFIFRRARACAQAAFARC